VTVENREKFQQQYQAGKEALERGEYHQSVRCLEAAKDLVAPTSRDGGEAGIWLVTAYQAANMLTEAIALCEELSNHPRLETRQQAKRLLYIIKAPKLSRPKEWMSEIPDLTNAASESSQYVTAKKSQKSSSEVKPAIEPLDRSSVQTEDNRFVWFALLIIILTAIGLFSMRSI
jgi:hypothetical protein